MKRPSVQRYSAYRLSHTLFGLSLGFCLLAQRPVDAVPASIKLNLFSAAPSNCYEIRHAQQFPTQGWQRLSSARVSHWTFYPRESDLQIRPCDHPDKVKTLRGKVYIAVNKSKKPTFLEVYHWCQSQDYVMSVVASETLPHWHPATFKALSVLIQNRLDRNPTSILPDSTTEGLFTGMDRITPTVRKAVEDTWGIRLLDKKHQILNGYYHAACAGHTSSESFFQGKPSSNINCPFCKYAALTPRHHSRIPKAAFEKVFGLGLPQVLTRDGAQRPLRVRWGSGKETSGYTFWLTLGQQFGWDKAPGTRFWIQTDHKSYLITSQGGGHGIGLCQWGAEAMASQGKPYEAILKWYYPNAILKIKVP